MVDPSQVPHRLRFKQFLISPEIEGIRRTMARGRDPSSKVIVEECYERCASQVGVLVLLSWWVGVISISAGSEVIGMFL